MNSDSEKTESVVKKDTRSASRYDAAIATFVGLCALCVSAYTAYMQRQQVRAMVWPILEFVSSNTPDFNWTLSNKGVGPAIIRNVVVKIDGQPAKDWIEVLEKLIGPKKPAAWIRSNAGPAPFSYSESDMSGRVLSPGETMTVFTVLDAEEKPIAYDRLSPLARQLNEDRFRVEVEICYSSTLGDCWILRAGGKTPNVTTPIGRCPGSSATSFSQ